MELSPTLSAIMCDGMGWFKPVDYKRALLIYDEIHYLLPSNTTEFDDVSGRKEQMVFPVLFSEQKHGFRVHHYSPDEQLRSSLIEAARIDADSAEFTEVVKHISAGEKLYTWRVVNSDAELGKGRSLGLSPEQEVLEAAQEFGRSGCVGPVAVVRVRHSLVALHDALDKLNNSTQTHRQRRAQALLRSYFRALLRGNL